MSDNALISIVLPVHNGELYLKESIESILAQEYPHWELILINDCSTDSSPEILKHYAQQDSRIRVSHNEKNLKLPLSLNKGFAEAKGQYLTWTSDDNIYRPSALKEMCHILNTHTEFDIVYTDYSNINDKGETLNKSQNNPPEYLLTANVVHACFLCRREVHEKLQAYNNEFCYVEDYEYWLRAAKYFCFYYLQKDLYLYRRHEAALTVTRRSEISGLIEKVRLRHTPEIKQFRKELRCRVFFDISHYHFKHKNYGRSLLVASAGFLNYPLETTKKIFSKLF